MREESLFEKLRSMAYNILLALLIIAYAILRYHNEKYALSHSHIYINKGLFIKKRKVGLSENIDAITVKRNFFSTVLFDACSFFADIPSVSKSTDTTIYVSNKRSLSLINELTGGLCLKLRYKASEGKIFFMSALWSNSVTGLLILAPFINNLGKILGEKFAQSVYDSVDFSYYLVYVGLPPVAAALANILLICWLFSFLVQLNRYLRFSVAVSDNFLIIKRGLLNRVLFITQPQSINALIIRQSIFMLPLSLYSAYINTISTEKTKDDKSLLIAAEKRGILQKHLKNYLPNMETIFTCSLHPNKRNVRSYLYFPIFILSLNAIPIVLLFFLSELDNLLYLVLVFFLPFSATWFFFRIIAFKRTEISYNESTIKAVSYRRFTVCENYIPLEKLQKISIRQSIFQRISKTCNISFYTFSENKLHFTVKHLPLDKCSNLAQELYRE